MNTTNSSHWHGYIPLASTLYSLVVFLLAILCNTMVISSIRSEMYKGSKKNIFLITKLGLACSDVGVAASMIPSIIHGFMNLSTRDTEYGGFNAVELSMNLIFTSASLNILAIMASQRYMAISNPFRYMKVSKRKQYLLVVSAWIPGFVLLAVYMVYRQYPSVTLASVSLMFYILLPFLILICCTVVMLLAYVRNRNNTVGAGGSVRGRRGANHGKLVTVTTMIVIGYSATCLPYVVSNYYYLSRDFLPFQYRNEPFATLTYNALYLNRLVDFIVYSVLDERFRLYIKNTFLRKAHTSTDPLSNLQSAML